MSKFSNDYENLKKQIDSESDKGKLIGYLFAGLIIGRIYEKLQRTKKKVFKRFKWINDFKKLLLLLFL